MNIKAAVIDLDGTLLTSGKQITERTKAALLAAQRQGLRLIFATARPPRAVVFENLDLSQLGTVVFYNGAMFECSSSKRAYHYPIVQALAGEVIDYCLSLNPAANISIEIMNKWYSYKALDYREMMHAKELPEMIPLEALKSFDCTKILISDFAESDKLLAKYSQALNILVTDGGMLVQMMAAGVSKEAACRHLCGNLGIGMNDVICFGDDYNDLGLFGECGHSVAMGNAVPALKQAASEITETNDRDGVANVLERWVQESSRSLL